MLMVIFGAGASYDSAQAYRVVPPSAGRQNFGNSPEQIDEGGPWRPPLAKDLFLDRHQAFGSIVRSYPKLAHILPYLREPSAGRSVEQTLESMQEESRGNPETVRELASVRYYLCHLMQKITNEWISRTNGVTNYAPLIRDILRFNRASVPVCLITFNYDLLLENALSTFGFNPSVPEEYVDSHPTLKLFKLHGSVNWCRLVDVPAGTRLQPQTLIEGANTIRLTDKFVRANATEPGEMFTFPQPIFPAIAIPVQTKSEEHFECPANHRRYLVSMLDQITKILIIGWQAKEAHFLHMLQYKLPLLKKVMVVGQNAADAQGVLKCFLDGIGRTMATDSVYRAQGGFTDFIVNAEGEKFFTA